MKRTMMEHAIPDKKEAGLLRQFLRLLMSYNDFKHANRIATYVLNLDADAEKQQGRWFLLEALNAAMVVAYCRPFSGNDKSTRLKIPDLPTRFLDCLTAQEREVHNVAISDRNTVLAHSDSEAWDMRPVVLAIGDQKILMPWSSYTRAPLTREATELLHSASKKLMEAVFSERMKLEPRLTKYFRDVTPEDIERDPMKMFCMEED